MTPRPSPSCRGAPRRRTVLAVAAAALVGCRAAPPPPSLFAPPADATPTPSADPPTRLRFEAGGRGVDFVHHAGRTPRRLMPEVLGGGVLATDLDADGDPDLLFADSGAVLGPPPPGAGPRAFRNDGRGGFTDWTVALGLAPAGYGMGVAAGDVDGDGFVDVYLTSFDGQDRLLRNAGGERLQDVTAAFGIAPSGWSTSAAFFDLEGDGDLDLYVVRYVGYDPLDPLDCAVGDVPVYCTPVMFPAQQDRVLRNDGGRFTDVTDEALAGVAPEKGLAVGTADLDDDGDTDLYVANDTGRNFYLRNDGGRFSDIGAQSGVAYSELGREEAGMGVAVGDADRDGRWDIAVTNFQSEPTALYRQDERGLFREVSDRFGVGETSRARLSFGVAWFDGDNDGDEDLVTANGHVYDLAARLQQGVAFEQPTSIYENVAPGRLSDVSTEVGPAFAEPLVGRGLAVADLDGDGGLDLVLVGSNGPARVLRAAGERGRFLSLLLRGKGPNTEAIGAQVTVTAGGRTLRREVRGGASYLSVDDRRVHVGLGAVEAVESVRVRWPDGTEQVVGSLPLDAFLLLRQGEEPVPYTPGAGPPGSAR